jgi:thioester reductase-like protein
MVTKEKTIFLTGATGLLGSYFLKILLEHGCKVYALSRSRSNKSAEERTMEVLSFWDRFTLNKNIKNLIVVDGDITKKDLGLDSHFQDLFTEIDEIFHCAALTDFNPHLEEALRVNVNGTKNILELAFKYNKKLNYISTAYVCGKHKGLFREDHLDLGQDFNTNYELSKFEAEKTILYYRNKGLWVDIFRPPIIVGESTSGRMPVSKLFKLHFYQILHVWYLEIFDAFPGKNYFTNIIPVDELAKSLFMISSNTSLKNKNYHLFHNRPVPLEEILNSFSAFLGFKKPRSLLFKDVAKNGFTPVQKMLLKNIYSPFNCHVQLDSKVTCKFLKEYGFKFSKVNTGLLRRLFKYLVEVGFLKKR